MVSIAERVVIQVPLAQAFAYYAEYAHIADWDPGVATSRKLTTGPLKQGDRYDVVSLFLGRKLPMTYEVVSVEAPTRIVLRGTSATGVAVDDIRFSAIDATTTAITYDTEVSDSDGMATLGTNADRLTCITPGLYRVTAAQHLAANATGIRYLTINKTGTAIAAHRALTIGAYTMTLTATCLVQLAAADYITQTLYQNTGGALVTDITLGGCYLHAEWIRE